MDNKYKVGDEFYADLTGMYHLIGDVRKVTITRLEPFKDHVNVEYKEACCVPTSVIFDSYHDAIEHRFKLNEAKKRFNAKSKKREQQFVRMILKAKASSGGALATGAENRLIDELNRYCIAYAACFEKELVDNMCKTTNSDRKLIIDANRAYISTLLKDILKTRFEELEDIFRRSVVFCLYTQTILHIVKTFAMATIESFENGSTDEVVYKPYDQIRKEQLQ